jgi:hypothetical protein
MSNTSTFGRTPSIGRIVHFSNNGTIYPAIITAVGEDTVDLQVFGVAADEAHRMWVTQDETHEAFWLWPRVA